MHQNGEVRIDALGRWRCEDQRGHRENDCAQQGKAARRHPPAQAVLEQENKGSMAEQVSTADAAVTTKSPLRRVRPVYMDDPFYPILRAG